MDKINKWQQQSSFSSNAQLLIEAAREKQIPVLKVDPEYDLFQLGQGKYSLLFRGLVAENSASILAGCNSSVMINKLLTALSFGPQNKLVDKSKENYKILIVDKQIKAALKISGSLKRDVLGQLNEQTKNLIIKLSELYNLTIAEIDLSSVDITVPVLQSGEITAININPPLNEYQEVVNVKEILYQLIDHYALGRIPIISVIGSTNQIVVKIIDKILNKIEVSTGVVINNVIHSYNFVTTHNSGGVKTILQDKEIEVLVHGIKPKELKESGLPYDNSSLLLVTDLKQREQLIRAQLNPKSIVLGIDKEFDPQIMRQCSEEKIIYCSLNYENLILQRQLQSKQPAVYTTDNNLVLFDGRDQLPVIALNRLIKVARNDSNIMLGILFAVAAAFMLDIPVFVTRSVLENLMGEEILDIAKNQ